MRNNCTSLYGLSSSEACCQWFHPVPSLRFHHRPALVKIDQRTCALNRTAPELLCRIQLQLASILQVLDSPLSYRMSPDHRVLVPLTEDLLLEQSASFLPQRRRYFPERLRYKALVEKPRLIPARLRRAYWPFNCPP